MNKLFVLIIIVLVLEGCGEQKSNIELIEDDSAVYFEINQLDKAPTFANSINIAEEVKEVFVNNWNDYSKINEPVLLGYYYFADENGKIKKLKRIKTGGRFGLNLPVNYSQTIEPGILDILEKVDFTPAIKDKRHVKFQSVLIYGLFKKDNNIEGKIYFGFGESPSSTLENLYLNAGSEYMISIDNPPLPKGGMIELQKNVKYPPEAKNKKLEGKVFVKAFIDENGNVVKTEIIKGTGTVLDTAAANAVMNTKFYSGKHAGVPVKVQIAVPIVFKLQ
jgi:TonB family protein